MMKAGTIVVLTLLVGFIGASDKESNRRHPVHQVADVIHKTDNTKPYEDSEFWKSQAQAKLAQKLNTTKIEGVAKNIIFYLGDGMDIKTVTAARILKGQKVDQLPFGEEGELHMDKMSVVGNSITFCSNRQVADSACTGTAYHCGSKTNVGVICVTPDVQRGSCEGQADEANHLSSALSWAQAAGKSTGIISNLELTDASTAPAYAHAADREWQDDEKVRESFADPKICEDIASQLITKNPGKNIDVILGGGRLHFFNAQYPDPEYPALRGLRRDGRNLVHEWQENHKNESAEYVTTREELLKVNTSTTTRLMGLFEPWHMSFLYENGLKRDPSLSEMTKVAIEILSKNPNGFFLYVYNGLIDGAHHYTVPQSALWEVIELDRALEVGDEMTQDNNTLIVVSADHAHTMHFAGYASRGRSILEYPEYSGADDGLPYNTLGYANGMGVMYPQRGTGRRNISGDPFNSLLYQPPAGVPKDQETHAGDDVPIYAKGPYAHFFSGTHQQSFIPHVMGYAACIGNGKVSKWCDSQSESTTTNTFPTEDTSPSSGSRMCLLQSIAVIFIFAIVLL